MASDGGREESLVGTCQQCGSDVPREAQFCPSCGSPPGAAEKPLVCGHCGHTVEPGFQFCASCGAALPEGPPFDGSVQDGSTGTARRTAPDQTGFSNVDSTVDEQKLKAFRRRLDPYLESGWEIDRDEGDTVGLEYRDFGSVRIHLVLLLFLLTIGWGNALYAIYSAFARKNSATLEADTDPRSWPDQDPTPGDSALHWVLGMAMILVTLLLIATSVGQPANPIGWLWVGSGLLAVGTLLPPINRRIKQRGSLTEFGWQTDTDQRLVHDSVQCAVCWSFVDVAVERSYEKYFAIAGTRVKTADSGENYYCEECSQTALSTSAYRELKELIEDHDTDAVETGRERSLDRERT